MSNKITATFVRKRIQDSGSDSTLDYQVCDFKNAEDSNGNKYGEKWIKETKLMQAVAFQSGKQYEIILSEKPYSINANSFPYPVQVSWDSGKVYIKNGNSIIKVDKNKQEENLSIPINRRLGISNYNTAARNKFGKGILTEELLLKMNSRGFYFFVHCKEKKNAVCSYGLTSNETSNYILVRKESKKEIAYYLNIVKQGYVNKAIAKHFKIITELH